MNNEISNDKIKRVSIFIVFFLRLFFLLAPISTPALVRRCASVILALVRELGTCVPDLKKRREGAKWRAVFGCLNGYASVGMHEWDRMRRNVPPTPPIHPVPSVFFPSSG